MTKNRPPLSPTARWMALGASLVVTGLTWMAGGPAQANVALTRADIEAILNRVELTPRGRSARLARSRDFMAVGDTLRTAAQSQAQLRFNDGSLARVGERATFQFLPNTRNFRLSNGTMLLLIPPGRGRSTIQTPSAITGIQGSAVVVRHVEERNLTIVMALTNNPAGPMTVTTLGCSDGSESCVSEYALYAGQMALVQDNQVEILEFDLPTFYDTSPITDGLELNNPDPTVSLGPDLDLVRAETLDALAGGGSFADAIMLNPNAVAINPDSPSAENEPWLLSPVFAETQPGGRPRSAMNTPNNLAGVSLGLPTRGNSPASGTQAIPGNAPTSQPPESSTTVQPSTPQPSVTQPPSAQPQATQPPVAQPPSAQSPTTQIPVAQPSVAQPPVAQPPVAQPPVTQPPVAEPPAPQPPLLEPSVPQTPAPEAPAPQPPLPEPPIPQTPAPEPPVPQTPAPEPPVPQTPVPETPLPDPNPQPPTGPGGPETPPPFGPNPPGQADPPATPPGIFDPPEKDPLAPLP